jgi:hypothetical protein
MKRKLCINGLRVTSFVTTLDAGERITLKGGAGADITNPCSLPLDVCTPNISMSCPTVPVIACVQDFSDRKCMEPQPTMIC